MKKLEIWEKLRNFVKINKFREKWKIPWKVRNFEKNEKLQEKWEILRKNEKYSEKFFQKFLDVHPEKEWGTPRAYHSWSKNVTVASPVMIMF